MKSDKIIIRKAHIQDARFIAQGNLAMAQETEHKTLTLETVVKGVENALQHPEFGFYIIAEQDHRPVGQLMITYEWSDWRNGVFWWIQSVYIVPEARGKGIFSRLQDFVMQLAREDSTVCGLRLYVARDNTRAKAVYRHLAWKPTNYELLEIDWSK